MNDLTMIFKILSDETRLRMLMLLYETPLCVCEISGVLEAPQPRISKNLSKLKDLGWVTDTRKEKFIMYTFCVEEPLLLMILDNLSHSIDQYPVLKSDKLRLADKESFLTQCIVNSK